MSRVLLIQPKTHGKTSVRPLGLAYLASSLLANGHSVKVFDNDIYGYRPEEIRGLERGWNPSFVGITTNILSQWNAREIGKHLSSKFLVVYGGPQATIAPEDFVGLNQRVLHGESERSLVALADIVEHGGNPECIVSSQVEKDLDALPFPNTTLFDFQKYQWHLEGRPCTNLVTSRGCPFKCIFCYHQMNPQFRQRSPGNVIEEMNELTSDHGFRAFKFFDDNFTLSPRFVEEFCEALVRLDRGWLWQCIGAAKTITGPKAALMARAGCRHVSMGIESGSQRSLEYMGKRTTVEQNLQAVASLRKAGIKSKAYLMLGFPWETAKDFAATESFVREAKPDIIQVFFVTPFPNTDLRHLVEKAGYEVDTEALRGARDFNLPSFETENFTRADLIRWRHRILDIHRSVAGGGIIRRILRRASRWLA